jgi:hypothetical protein
LTYVIQEATANGRWQTLDRSYYKTLAAHGVLGKLKAANKSRILRVAHERTLRVAHPPELESLIPFMWLRGFSLFAVNRAISYVQDIGEMLDSEPASQAA